MERKWGGRLLAHTATSAPTSASELHSRVRREREIEAGELQGVSVCARTAKITCCEELGSLGGGKSVCV